MSADAARVGKHAPTKVLAAAPHRPVANDGTLARFATTAPRPDDVWRPSDDHAALAEARTLFPSTVVAPHASPAFLVSGHNNPKLGKEVRKGPWAGLPIYHLTLEERATCPRSCKQWATCFGNSMHLARRHDHAHPDFLPLLRAELVTLARKHGGSLALRLHTLGDFYSVEYVRFWADMLDLLPGLRIFGFTARRVDADDASSRQIALALRWLTEQAWDAFAIRFSGHDGPQGAIVVSEDDTRESIIMCPAQRHDTAACATCGLCWSETARGSTIAFLLHGRSASRHGRRKHAP